VRKGHELMNHDTVVKNLVAKVKDTIFSHEMVAPQDKVVVAVSGGPDSVCLLDVLFALKDELQISLVVAHFEHGLRPGEDQQETEFVSRLAGSYGLEFYTERASAGLAYGRGSLEERARKERYQFLTKIKEKVKAQKIALGHQLDDQAETVLMRLLRGSGPLGLGAIPPVRDALIIRPLIKVSREEVQDYLRQKGILWMQDSSNLQPVHMRNRIRLELLPMLKMYQPRILEVLARTAEIIREDENILVSQAQEWLDQNALRLKQDQISIAIDKLSQLPKALQRRVLRCAIGHVGQGLRKISLKHLDLTLHMCFAKAPQGQIYLPGNLAVKKRYNQIIIAPKSYEHYKRYRYKLQGPGVYKLEAIESSIEVAELDYLQMDATGAPPWTAYLDASKIEFPLIVRPFQRGDRFVPLGMKGTKKLHDLFVDMKIPTELRNELPIVCSGSSIVWVTGLRIDERFKVTKEGEKVLKLAIHGAITEELERWRR